MNDMWKMNYTGGVEYMKAITTELKSSGETKGYFSTGTLTVTYPGYKNIGDYKLVEGDVAPKHTDVVKYIFETTTREKFKHVVASLDEVYNEGLNATTTCFTREFKEKLYWITLQEEINYPPPSMGRKLPFQRYYEAALVKICGGKVDVVLQRTNNHFSGVPALWDTKRYFKPSFYR